MVSALFVYNVAVSTGSMEAIKRTLPGISEDRRVQAFILAFGFGGFPEAVAGFSKAVVIPAGIMAAMGFEPLLAASVSAACRSKPRRSCTSAPSGWRWPTRAAPRLAR